MDDFAGKTAVITGGASGIGFATAQRLAREGMNIVVADIEQPAIDRALPQLEALGVRALGVRTDVTKLADVQALADRTWERFGGCHLLFNNAGVAVMAPILETRHEDWRWVIDVDLWGPIHGVEVFVPRMVKQDQGGHIVSTASFAGMVPNDGLGAYCVAKYGVVALSECLYREMTPYGIGVSVLCPMRVETNINAGERNRQPEFGSPRRSEEVAEGTAAAVAGSIVTPEQVADIVLAGVREKKLYLFTHPESRGFVQARFRRIDRAYD